MCRGLSGRARRVSDRVSCRGMDATKPPSHVVEDCERLLQKGAAMSGLEEELSMLRGRVERGDILALRIGMRRIAEGLLRHIAREEGVLDPEKRAHAELQALIQEVTPRLRARTSPDFIHHLHLLKGLGNVSAHLRSDDVYKQPGLRPGDPWAGVKAGFISIEYLFGEFTALYPPPIAPTVVEAPKEPPAEERSTPAPRQPAGATSTTDLGAMTASRALADLSIRQKLAQVTGWTQTKVTRRLGSVHGKVLVRNILPLDGEVHEPPPGEAETAEDDITYESIGDLTLSNVQALGLIEDVARLADLTPRQVNNRFTKHRGNMLVRRAFPEWYDASVIVRLTVRTAIDYSMTSLLARHLELREADLAKRLREVPGQTKLASILPELA